MKMFFGLASASLLFILAIMPAGAQAGISISDASYRVDYPKQIVFHLAGSSSNPISTATLVVRFAATGLTTRIQAQTKSDMQVDATVDWNLRGEGTSAVGGYLPPGAKGEFSWHLEDQTGNKVDTPFQPFRVDDNRQSWEQLKNEQLVLYWQGLSRQQGQQVFDKATQTLAAIQNDIGATLSSQVQIFVWGDRNAFMTALSPGQKEWAGGTIDADFGVVLIDGSSGDLSYVLDTAPHELTHLVLAQYLKGPYRDITMPLWMNEGLAVYHEFIPPKDEPRFDAALRRGIQTDTLTRLRSMDLSFPSDPALAEMAYGQAFSVVDFMMRTYGPDKLKQIMQLFKTGSTGDEAFGKVIGVDEDGLENLWRKSVGAQNKTYLKPPTPTPGAVPTFSFSSAATPGAPTPTTASVAVAQTPASSSNPGGGPAQSGPGGGGFCGGIFGVVGLVALTAWRRQRTRPLQG